ncbi:MAG TPA: hypothetical protein VEI06_03035 [Gemmatimonadaceae bacterium]|nr:hypothetical protein [Gemmatimonadaceae bacterium]
MARILAASRAACCIIVVCALAGAHVATAQQWNDSTTRALVARATARRAQQLADTALSDYTATAHGYLTFLAQVGEGLREPPKVVRADELVLEVYWRSPNLSKQRIIGRRDTLPLPTDIQYHRDHLGIVQNNFPNIIRLGEGDEVRDVPHPLSDVGFALYDFVIHDSLSIKLPDRTIGVYEVQVRPKQPEQPRLVGAIYIDTATAEVVRMAFNFTRPAYLDEQLEDISVVLENALVGGRFWLPREQEIEIRRTGTWLDFPVRGIIRGRWEVCCYQLNNGLSPAIFAGPEIVQAPARELARYPWTGRILDSLPPDVRAVTDADVQRVQEEARELVRRQALARPAGAAITGTQISDFVRVNRVEGLAVGGGAVLRFGEGLSVGLSGRWGFDDEQAKGRLAFRAQWATGRSVELFAEREYRNASDFQERSLLVNSFASQEFGSDFTQPYDVRGAGVGFELGRIPGTRIRLAGAWERQGALSVHATPFTGEYEPTIPAWSIDEARFSLLVDRPTTLSLLGTEVRLRAEVRGGWFTGHDTTFSEASPTFARVVAAVNVERPIGDQRLVLATLVGAVTARPDVPPQEYIFVGGPTSLPGFDYSRFASRFAASQRIEWHAPVPFFAVPLGAFGSSPATMTLAPFAAVGYVDRSAPFAAPAEGWYPSVGLGALFFYDLLRFDIARGLRDGAWTFEFDVTRLLWPIL